MSPEPEKEDGTPTDDAAVEDPETTTASERTREIIHTLAVGLTRLGKRLEQLRDEVADMAEESGARQRAEDIAKTAAERARDTQHAATVAARRVRLASEQVARNARHKAAEAAHAADDALGRARTAASEIAHRTGSTTEHTVERLQGLTDEFGERARAAKETGRDFYVEHREEILALLMTAAKVAAVVGLRRLAAPREDEEGLETRKGRQQATKRVLDASSLLVAIIGQIGSLLSRQPTSLPMLREMYAQGEPAEQAVVGMLLGPTLSSDPDHAVEVVREFLESATSEGAADTIARRTLAPLLTEHPELVERVTPWFQAAAPFVRRAALVSLARYVSDRRSRVGDLVAAAVVVLEDHDEEVRQALGRFFRSTDAVDPEGTARAIAAHLDAEAAAGRRAAEALVRTLPEELQERIDAARTDREA